MAVTNKPCAARTGFGRRFWCMLAGNAAIGAGIGVLRLASFGVDAYTSMNLSVSNFLGMQFGTWQLIVNAAIFVVVWRLRPQSIGLGTLVNMVGVGYMADAICWLAQPAAGGGLGLPLRAAALVLGLVIVSIGAALYMEADMGVAPYDAVGSLLEQFSGGRLHYGKARVISDVTVVLVGAAVCLYAGNSLGSILGIGTVCNALCNGPMIQFFRTHLARRLLG